SARAVEETAAAIALEAPRAKEYSQAVVQAHFIKRFEAHIRALRREDVIETRQRGCLEPVDEYVLRVARDEAGEIMGEKRRILAAEMQKLGTFTEEQITMASARALALIEDRAALITLMDLWDKEDMMHWASQVLGRWTQLAGDTGSTNGVTI